MPGRFDATDFARKAIAAVALLDEQCGIAFLTDFLTGSGSERILEEHRQLETFGSGSHISKQDWLNLIRDFVSLGYLRRAAGAGDSLQITEKGWNVLNGNTEVVLNRVPFRINEKIVTNKNLKKSSPDFEPDLLFALKDVRRYLASSREVEADDVVSYLKLHQMATWLPDNLHDLKNVAGFDDGQLKSYGQPFLKVILDYLAVNGLQSRMNLKRR